MEITALFCDRAEVTGDGKCNIEGVFNELYAPGFPARQDAMTLVGVIQWDREDSGRQPFVIHLLHPDGDPVYTIDGHSDVEPRDPQRPPAKTYLVLPMEKVIFTEPGCYRARIRVKEREVNGPALYVMRTAMEEAV